MKGQTRGAVAGAPRLILRLEGAALAASAVYFYRHLNASWILFAVLFFAPDLSFLAYLSSSRAGALAYNAAHATLGPLALLVSGVLFGSSLAEHIALIWLAHIGVDRALGYGLKYPSAFNDTHLGRIGVEKA